MNIYTLTSLIAAIVTSSLCIAAPQNNMSQTDTDKIETFTVTGTYLPDTTTNGRIAKITISSEEIATLATNSIADVLRGLPGIDVIEQGGVGGLTFLSIRGGDPNFVAIIIDGVKVNDPTNSRGGAFDLGTLDPAIIEQIEVFYGGFSTLHGSDALAGMLSITIKGAQAGHLGYLSVKAGTANVRGANLHLATNFNDIAQLSLNASFQDNDNSHFGGAFNRTEVSGTLKPVAQSESQWQIATFYAKGQAQMFPEDSGGDRLAVISSPEKREFSQQNISAGYKKNLTNSVALNFNSAWSQRKEDDSHPGIAPGVLDGVPAINSQTSYQRLDLNASGSFLFSSNASIALGLAYSDEAGAMNSIIDFGAPVPAAYTLKRNTESIFAELGIDPTSSLSITTGLRHDNSEHSSIMTKRLIARYQLGKTMMVSMQYSEGFKLPSFFALAHPFVGNDALKPERSENYDLSIKADFLNKKLMAQLSIYDNTFSDLVDFDPVAFTNVNRSKVRANGAELSVAYTPTEQFNLAGQVSYNNIDALDANTVLRRRPVWKGSLQLNYSPLEALALMTRLSSNDDYFDSSIPTSMVTVKGYSQVDMSATWLLTPQMSLRFNVTNVFDNTAEQSIGFANMGRNCMFTFSTRF